MGEKEWWVKYRRQQFEKRHGGESTGKFVSVSSLWNIMIEIENNSLTEWDDLPEETEQVPVKEHNPKKQGLSS